MYLLFFSSFPGANVLIHKKRQKPPMPLMPESKGYQKRACCKLLKTEIFKLFLAKESNQGVAERGVFVWIKKKKTTLVPSHCIPRLSIKRITCTWL